MAVALLVHLYGRPPMTLGETSSFATPLAAFTLQAPSFAHRMHSFGPSDARAMTRSVPLVSCLSTTLWLVVVLTLHSETAAMARCVDEAGAANTVVVVALAMLPFELPGVSVPLALST